MKGRSPTCCASPAAEGAQAQDNFKKATISRAEGGRVHARVSWQFGTGFDLRTSRQTAQQAVS